MSAPNRVTPWGSVVPAPGRGAWTGNRGCLHPRTGAHEIVRRQTTARWITCRLRFRDRRVPQWAPGRYTPLFFLDEAVALAAGHRPCAECRHTDHVLFRDAWARAHGGCAPRAGEMDACLAEQRRPVGGRRQLHRLQWADVPVGAMVATGDGAATVSEEALLPWLPDNRYGPALPRPSRGSVDVLTPQAATLALRAGYVPQRAQPTSAAIRSATSLARS